jgi:hypothetical protein
MVRTFASAAVVFLCLSGCSKDSSSFEGEIVLHTTRAGAPPSDMVVKTKGGNIRFDTKTPAGTPATAIFLPAQNALTMIDDANKLAFQMDLSSGDAAPNTSAQTSDVAKTGKTETIAGRSCEEWTVKDPSGKHTDVCIAEGLAYFDLDALRSGGGSAWNQKLREKKMFALRSIEFDATGKEISRTEATRIEKKKMDDAMFQVPADYRRMTPPRAP